MLGCTGLRWAILGCPGGPGDPGDVGGPGGKRVTSDRHCQVGWGD